MWFLINETLGKYLMLFAMAKQYYGITIHVYWNLNILTLTTTENMTTPFKIEYQIPRIICFILVIIII